MATFPTALAKIYFFRVVLIWRKNLLYLVGTVLNAKTKHFLLNCKIVEVGEQLPFFLVTLFEARVRFPSSIIQSKIIASTIKYSTKYSKVFFATCVFIPQCVYCRHDLLLSNRLFIFLKFTQNLKRNAV